MPEARVTELAPEAVEGAALPLEGVHHVHGGDGLPLGVLGVGDGVTDDVLQEDLRKWLNNLHRSGCQEQLP